MPTIQVKDAGGTTIYLNVASGAGTSGDPYVLQDSIPTGTNSIGTMGLNTGSNAIGKLAAGTAEIGKLAAGSAAIGSVSVSSGAITETNSGAIKTAVELIDNVVDGSEMQVDVVTMPTVTETNSSAIKTAVELLDNAISGTEMQVDVVGALPTGSNAIGKLADGTAELGATTDRSPPGHSHIPRRQT